MTFQAHDLLAASRKALNAQLWAMALDLPARARVTQPLIREHARPALWKYPCVQRQHFNNWLNAAVLRSLSPSYDVLAERRNADQHQRNLLLTSLVHTRYLVNIS